MHGLHRMLSAACCPMQADDDEQHASVSNGSAKSEAKGQKKRKKVDDRPLTNLFASPWDSDPGSITDSSSSEKGDEDEHEKQDVRHTAAEAGFVPEQEASIIDRRAIVRYHADPRREPEVIDITQHAPPPPPSSSEGQPLHYDVTLHLDVTTGCGGKIWPAAEVLGAYIASSPRYAGRPSPWRGKTIVELGSGTGLVGLLVARMTLGVQGIWITDQIPMLELMRQNLALACDHSPPSSSSADFSRVHIAELNWGEPLPAPTGSPTGSPSDVPRKPDVLLLADCVYLEAAFRPLYETLLLLSRSPSDRASSSEATEETETEILFCYVKRRKADARFFSMLKKKFAFEPVGDDDPGRTAAYRKQSVSLLRIRRVKD